MARNSFLKETLSNYDSRQFYMIPTTEWISTDALYAKTDV